MAHQSWRVPVPRRWAALFLGLLLLTPTLRAPGAATGRTLTVCFSGCDHTTIQAAADVAADGDTVQIRSSVPHTEAGITINRDLTVEGLGMDRTTVQAASSPPGPDRVFHLTAGTVVTIRNMTVRYGSALGSSGGGIYNDGGTLSLDHVRLTRNQAAHGGGLYSRGPATIRHSKITHNTTTDSFSGGGAGISASGPLILLHSQVGYNKAFEETRGSGIVCFGEATIMDTVVEHNQGRGTGGADLYGPATVANSIFRHNTSDAEGGGLFVGDQSSIHSSDIYSNTASRGGGVYQGLADGVEIRHTTIRDNSATWNGGGIYVYSRELFVVNSTISGNRADEHGGGLHIFQEGQASLANVTISDNTADADQDNVGHGGGIYLERQGSDQGVAVVRNSIVAGNHDASPSLVGGTAPDCYRTLTSEGYNLVGNLGISSIGGSPLCSLQGDLSGNLTGVGAQLGLLADNGGPTLTHAQDSGSPVVNAGHPAGCKDFGGKTLDQDQRFMTRVDRCDMGAYEANALDNRVYLPLIIR
jgi:hypothetical protein